MNAWLSNSFLPNRDSIQVHYKFLINDQMDIVVILKKFNIVIFITKCSLVYETF